MADLFRLGVSLFLVDRISSDMRRVGQSSRVTARDVEILEQKVTALNRVFTAQQGAERAAQALAVWNRENLAAVRGIDANIQALDKYRAALTNLQGRLQRQGRYSIGAGIAAGGAMGMAEQMKDEQSVLQIQRQRLESAANLSKTEEARYEQLQKQLSTEEQLLAMQSRREGMMQQRKAGIAEWGMLTGFAIAGAGETIGRLAMGPVAAAMPIEQQMAILQGQLGLTPEFVENLFKQSVQIAGRTGLYSGGDVFNILSSMLLGGANPDALGRIGSTAVFGAEALEKAGRGAGAETTASLVKLAQAAGITDPDAMKRLDEQLFSLLARAPTGVTASEFINRMLNVMPGIRARGGTVEDALRFSAFAEFAGGKGGLTSNLLFSFLTRLQTPGIGAAGARATAGMRMLGITPEEDIEKVTSQLQADFRSMGPEKFATLAYLAFGGMRGMKTAETLATMGPALQEIWDRVNTQFAQAMSGPIETFQAKFMNNLQAQVTNLQTNLGSVAQVLGHDVNPSLVGMFKALNDDVMAMIKWLQVHPSAGTAAWIATTGTSAGLDIAGKGMLYGALASMIPGMEWATGILGLGGVAVGTGVAGLGGALALYAWLMEHPDIADKVGSALAGVGGAGVISGPGAMMPPAAGPTPDAITVHPRVPSLSTSGAGIHIEGGIHVHIGGSPTAKDADAIKKAVAEGVHRGLYRVVTGAEGVEHEWAFTTPDMVTAFG